MSVMVKQRYRSRRNLFIILIISIIIISKLTRERNVEREFNLNITRRVIEANLQETLKEDKGAGCQIPYVDPFAKEVTQFDKDMPTINCTGQDWVKCYFSECRVVEEILETSKDIVCYYKDIIYVSDFNYHLGPETEVVGELPYILNKSDHVKIECYATREDSGLKSRWIGFSLGFRTSVERKPVPPNREDSLNVLMFGFDSVSKNSLIRRLPKSYDFLKNHIKATIFNGYNVVGDGTMAALFPILAGKTELELPEFRRGMKPNATLDYRTLIFYKAMINGYRTAYFEDLPWYGTFQNRHNGFNHQPTDHYLRVFLLQETEDRYTIGEKRSDFCIGDTPQFKLMMNITEQFLQLDGKKFCFTFISDITHDEFNWISNADDATLNFFQTLVERDIFEDTLFIVMGDHGARFAKVRNTLQGKLEERLPFMSFRLPEKFKRSRPHAQAILEQNVDALTTPHDIHATLLDILDWSQHMNPYKIPGADLPRGMSLLEPIPRNRSCSEAGIERHWCSCLVWNNVTRDEIMYQRTAEAFIKYINELTESVRFACVLRELIEVEWVMRQQQNNRLLSYIKNKDPDNYLGKFGAETKGARETYQIKVTVDPGHSMYEVTLAYIRNEDRFLIDTRDISRTNAYGNEPSCISATHPHLNMYCYCIDYVSERV